MLKRGRRDTLFARLFLLILLTLVGSHLVAWLVITRWAMPAAPPPPLASVSGSASAPRPAPPLPVLGSLPPTPGLSGQALPAENAALPLPVLLADYGLRLLLIALAAGWGARWLARPVARMTAAARSLGAGVARGQAPAPLDENQGTVEVRDAAAVFNQMAAQLAQEFRARGLLMASISHDLRTPLTRMRIRLENLLPNPMALRCIEDIHEMDGLIDGAIAVFRADGAGDEAPQATDILALVQALTDDLVETGQPVQLHGDSVVAAVKPAALRRAVSNLIGNALRYSGAAEVSVRANGGAAGGARILIEDRGPGIPEDQLDRVLEPFYRVDPSRSRDTGGAGLGLHIARSLLQGQGATLNLSNRPGGGLRVDITLNNTAPAPASAAALSR